MPRLPLNRATGKPAFQSHNTPASPPVAPSVPPAPAKRPFTARQQAFIDNYVVSKNATDAARKAGYSIASANVQGTQNLANLSIRAEVDRRLAVQAEKLGVTADWVKEELRKVAAANVLDYMRIGDGGSPVVDFSAMTRDQGAALKGVTIEEFTDGRSDKRQVRRIKFIRGDKEKALELLGKHFNLWTDQVEHNHTHQHTLLGVLLTEIDEESRALVIEHKEDEAA